MVIASFLLKPGTSSNSFDQNSVSLLDLLLCPHVIFLKLLTQRAPSPTLKPALQRACVEFALTLCATLFPSLPCRLVSAVVEQPPEGFEALLRDPCD